MFTTDSMIDAVQNGKKTFVKTFVQNETVAEALNEYVDQQTDYTKKSINATRDMISTLTQETIKSAQEAMKFDYFKFADAFKQTAQSKKSK